MHQHGPLQCFLLISRLWNCVKSLWLSGGNKNMACDVSTVELLWLDDWNTGESPKKIAQLILHENLPTEKLGHEL